MSTSIKRSEFVTFIDVSATETPDYALIGDGVTSAKVNYNPQNSEEVYINEDSGTTEVESYKPVMPLELKCKKGDAAWAKFESMRRTRAVLGAAHANIVMVYLYEAAVTGAYPAELQDVSIQVDDFGGDGGKTNVLNITMNFCGDATQGTFNPTTKTFTPDA